MEGEINGLIKVFLSILTSLSYCYFLVSQIPKGNIRLISLLPVCYLFFLLPFSLSSVHFRGIIAFAISWLANFKLLLFAFDQGPLSSPISLLRFISICSLPLKIKPPNPSPQLLLSKPTPKSPFKTPIKLLIFVLLIRIHDYKQQIHPKVMCVLYGLIVYFFAETVLSASAILARVLLDLEVEPQFDEPYLSTSLQDFWGRRWNLVVTSILRPTVYVPVRCFSTRMFGGRSRTWAPLPALLATFLVSGLMHELLYFYITRVRPTWEVTLFFVLHGICLAIEIEVKKALSGRWRLHPVVSVPLAVGFVSVTGFWLFFPQLLRNGVDDRATREYRSLIEFVKEKWVWIIHGSSSPL